MPPSLFRPEVLVERKTQWLGTVLLVPRPAHALYVSFALAATAAIAAFLFFGGYTRKARLDGWLAPDKGLLQVFAPESGVVTEVCAKEGAEVRKGDALVKISSELQSAALGATRSEVIRRLEQRRQSLLGQRREVALLRDQQQASLSQRIAALDGEIAGFGDGIHLQRRRAVLARKTKLRQLKLHHANMISDEQLQASSENLLDQASKLRDLQRARAAVGAESLSLRGELRDLPLKAQAELANVDRAVASVEQELAEAEARREIVIPAPESGTVTAVQADVGARPAANAPLVSIVPQGSRLEARLLAPSRDIGFVRAGQRVVLRYQAFPYQKFGHQSGTVASVSRSALNPAELPPSLALSPARAEGAEPVYRITVQLDKQFVTAYGQPATLAPGMRLEADVVLERRRLYEWVMEPLYTLTGKWRQ